jgi:hypothetical protein
MLVALSLNALLDDVEKLILLNSKGGLSWENVYQACGSLRSCDTVANVMTVSNTKKDWSQVICLLCGEKRQGVKFCRQNKNRVNQQEKRVYECAVQDPTPTDSDNIKDDFDYVIVNL